METGEVKFFDAGKGWGFIAPSNGGKDVFVHISEVVRAGLKTLAEGDRVTFHLSPSKKHAGKMSATQLRRTN